MFYRDNYYEGRYDDKYFIEYDNLYVLVICVKTLCILQNIKIELDLNEHKMNKFRSIEMLFHMKKAHKMFIQLTVDYAHRSILVFDTNSEKHYLTDKNILAPIISSFDSGDRYISTGTIRYSMKEDVLYAVCRKQQLDESERNRRPYRSVIGPLYHCWIEVKTFRYENEKFVEAGTKWKSSVEEMNTFYNDPKIFSACFV